MFISERDTSLANVIIDEIIVREFKNHNLTKTFLIDISNFKLQIYFRYLNGLFTYFNPAKDRN